MITVAGTNGKGSHLRHAGSRSLRAAGYRVGLYQKPELVHFEERCRVDGQRVPARGAAAALRGGGARARRHSRCHATSSPRWPSRGCSAWSRWTWSILEVGHGRALRRRERLRRLTAPVITSIDLDHMEFLGPGPREHRPGEGAGHAPGPPGGRQRPRAAGQRGAPRARKSAPTCGSWGATSATTATASSGTGAGRSRRHAGLGYPALRGANQLLNAAGVLALLEALGAVLPVSAQAVRAGLATGGAAWPLPGRCPASPTLVLDVAHNPQSVAALAVNLDQMGFHPRTHAGVRGRCATRTSPACCRASRRSSTAGTCATCRCRGPRAAAELDAVVAALPQAQRATRHQHAGPAAGAARRVGRRGPR
jgi:dihydrofolate synthase/folylpolyglutamate synthase